MRHKKEIIEGPETYQSDLGLLNPDAPRILNIVDTVSNKKIVFFDLETGGFSKTDDILQIAAKCDDKSFSIYITPTQRINEKASDITGLRVVDGKLQCHGNVVSTVSLSQALQEFYNFLCDLQGRCILVAHNCNFDRPRLLTAIEKTFLLNHFKTVVQGFVDTLPLIKEITKLTKKGDNKLENLANLYNIPTMNAHNAISDCIMLEQVIVKLDISSQKLIKNILPWEKAIELKNYTSNLTNNLKNLEALKSCTSLATRKRIIAADIRYETIIDTFNENKLAGLVSLFGEDQNAVIAVTKNRSVIKKIAEFLEKTSTTSSII